MTTHEESALPEAGTWSGATATATSDVADVAGQARLRAQDAARAAGVTVRVVSSLAEVQMVGALYAGIWARDTSAAVSTELLRAFVKTGNYVAGAFDGTVLVGACVGFFAAPAERSLHSHIAGVAPFVRGRSVGYALKLHQRAWALSRDVHEVAWTFDPLVSRNAYFNVAKLAARPVEYLPNFYGGMEDGINAGSDSDRLLVRWTLDRPDVVQACAGRPAVADAVAERAGGAVVALGSSPLGVPVRGPLDASVLLVAVPTDIETMRRNDPALANEWRSATRETLTALMAAGALLSGFDRTGWYVVRRPDAAWQDDARQEGTR